MAATMIYVAPTAVLVGDVSVAEGGSVWHGAVLRGDFDAVVVGKDSNVQDNAVLHVDRRMPCEIGDHVTVGHSAVVHGTKVLGDSLIGMHATLNSGTVVRRGSLVAAGTVTRENAEFPEESVIAGVPARVLRKVDETLWKRIELSWEIYRDLAKASLPARPAILADPSRQIPFEKSEEFTRLVRKG
ncbi:MAG TPA: gamma carbonic anhydrase family protein [Thermoplasmata archaeon]|nr:gamma carbonic anhydrase family protein [Thermoplasmata archaeon]